MTPRRLYLYGVSAYDPIARLYDPWSSVLIDDISFYVEEALAAGSGPLVELGVGTGRIAIPTAMAGVHLIGVDSPPESVAGSGQASAASRPGSPCGSGTYGGRLSTNSSRSSRAHSVRTCIWRATRSG